MSIVEPATIIRRPHTRPRHTRPLCIPEKISIGSNVTNYNAAEGVVVSIVISVVLVFVCCLVIAVVCCVIQAQARNKRATARTTPARNIPHGPPLRTLTPVANAITVSPVSSSDDIPIATVTGFRRAETVDAEMLMPAPHASTMGDDMDSLPVAVATAL